MTTVQKIIRALFVSTTLLIVPISASFSLEGWNWSKGDYVFAWVMFTLASLAFTFLITSVKPSAYKLGASLAVVGAFLLIWINGAVGIIGEGDVNLLYALVIFVLFIGAIVARLRPRGMSYVLFGAAVVQALIPLGAFIISTPDFAPGVLQVFVLNGFFVMLFAGSGLLFRQASVLQEK